MPSASSQLRCGTHAHLREMPPFVEMRGSSAHTGASAAVGRVAAVTRLTRAADGARMLDGGDS